MLSYVIFLFISGVLYSIGRQMKIIKHYYDDRTSQEVMKIFDRIMRSIYYNWPLEKIEIFITDLDRGDVWLDNNSARIFIGKENHFIKERDEKGIEFLLLNKIYSLILKIGGFDLSDLREKYYNTDRLLFESFLLMEDFLVNRQLAKKFPDAVFYKTFAEMSRSGGASIMDSLRMSLNRVLFYGLDKWNTGYLERISDEICKNPKFLDTEKKIKELFDYKGRIDKEDIEMLMDLVRNEIGKSELTDAI